MNRKNLEKVIMLSLVLSSIGSGSAMAWEWGLNNSGGGTFNITDASKTYSKHSTTDKAFGIINANSSTLTANDIVLDVSSAGNEATGFFNDGGSVYTGNNMDLTVVGGQGVFIVQGIVNQSLASAGTSKFTADDIKMDLTGYGSELYGIINGSHGSTGNNGVEFSAGNIDIIAANAININGKGSTAANKAQVNGTAQFNMLGNIKVSNGGRIDLEMTEGSFWQGAAGIDAGNGSTSSLSFGNNAVWKLTGNSEVTDLTLDGAWLDMTADGNAFSTLKTESLNGSGGTIILDVDGTAVDQADKLYVTDTFTGTQALKLHEINGRDNDPTLGKDALGTILASVNINNGTFTAVDGEGSLFWQRYELGQQASNTGGYTTDWYLKEIENISPAERPTTTVESVLAAGALNYYTWRSENDKLMQRMGELRHNGDDAKGVWFRVNGSKIGRSGSWGFENKYTAYELGYDEVIKRTDDFVRYNGVALNYTDGSSSYRSGNGGNDAKAISFYGTQIGSKGHYLDVLFKISRLANDFTVYDSNANKITGELDNVGVAVSAEYGRKNVLSRGWYIEPQAQLTLGYLGGDSYQTSNGITVQQGGINSVVGRVGFNLGREIGNQANIYVKANLLHEFGGGYDVTMADSGGNRFKAADAFNDTWFEYGIGAALKTGSNSHIYIDVERSSGSDFKKDWQWNAGARWTF